MGLLKGQDPLRLLSLSGFEWVLSQAVLEEAMRIEAQQLEVVNQHLGAVIAEKLARFLGLII